MRAMRLIWAVLTYAPPLPWKPSRTARWTVGTIGVCLLTLVVALIVLELWTDREFGRLQLQIRDLIQAGRYDEAMGLVRELEEQANHNLGTQERIQSGIATALFNAANVNQAAYRTAEAERLFRQSLALYEKAVGPEHVFVGRVLLQLGGLLMGTNRPAEAELALTRALAIFEKDSGATGADLGSVLVALASLRPPQEGVGLVSRGLALQEQYFGPENEAVSGTLIARAQILRSANRLAEAEQVLQRAVAVAEKSKGPEHPFVAFALRALADLIAASNRLPEAEPLMRRALAIHEKSEGSEHPNLAGVLQNLGMLVEATQGAAEAEPLYRRMLAIYEKNLGPRHAAVALSLNMLARSYAVRGDWPEAARLSRRASSISIEMRHVVPGSRPDLSRAVLMSNTVGLRAAARAIHRADPDGAAARDEAFQLAQWAQQPAAADALTLMTARFAKGAGPQAELARTRQGLVERRVAQDKLLTSAMGAADLKAEEAIRAGLARLDAEIASVDERLTSELPDLAALADPQPLSIAAVQALLGPNEALVLFLDLPEISRELREEALVWAITREQAVLRSIALGSRAFIEEVRALRCGLDATNWEDPAGWKDETEQQKLRIAIQKERRDTCKALLGVEVSDKDWPPFDLARAHKLHTALLAPVADVTRGKDLIIVPSGALASLPFHVLVTEAPDPALTGMERYQRAAWLALQQATTVLPSVSSLQALRKLAPSLATEPYLAFGNPLLLGEGGDDKSAWERQACRPQAQGTQMAHAAHAAGSARRMRGIDLARLRLTEPLPETAEEICAVAETLGAASDEQHTVWLGERATEGNLKLLSRQHELGRYKILHFATHGLLADESRAIADGKAEPALLLTPPKDGLSPAALEEDDGLLTASEVGQLDLDADWVILSACNTAAGSADTGGEALSGLARAFFYAKARALLVSYWYVDSAAAVGLITAAFAELKANPGIGRAEALRRSMARSIADADPEAAHPSAWAPFVLVGNGT